MSLPALSFTALLLLAPACDAGDAADATPSAPTSAEATTGPVARIVVVGQVEACDCTRKRIADGEAALSAALGSRTIPVERLEADDPEDRDEVQLLRELRPLMVAPGIYFFDARDNLVGMTQGETSAEELSLILGEG